jgi:serine/threonine protein kinase
LSAALPKIFGGYTLVERLGVGGTASVYLGRKRLHDGFEWVALKCLHPHLVEIEEIARMFLVEAELLSRLHHPNVCEILRYGTEDGLPFIATRYLKGASLDVLVKKLKGRAIPVDLMAWIAAEACAGLHHAHEAVDELGAPLEIVHRDVSPQNIFVTIEGKVQLLDFGIAHAAMYAQATLSGDIKGKDGYMSPEQISGAMLDRRSDVFALGIVLWEAITGKRLFARENSLATALAISEQPAPDPRTMNPHVAAALSKVALRALALEPDDRFATALDMETALRDTLSDDLSPQIQLQALARDVLDPDSKATDVDQMWMDPTDSDEDSADLTEVYVPPEDETLPVPIAAPKVDRTANMRAPSKTGTDDTVSMASSPADETLPVPIPKQKKRVKIWPLAVAVAILAAIGLALGLAWNG